MPGDGHLGGRGAIGLSHVEFELDAVIGPLALDTVGLGYMGRDGIGCRFIERLEHLPIVAFDADGIVGLSQTNREHFTNSRVRAQNGDMEQRNRVHHAVRQQFRAGAFGQQEIFPMVDCVGSAGELMPDDRADFLHRWDWSFRHELSSFSTKLLVWQPGLSRAVIVKSRSSLH